MNSFIQYLKQIPMEDAVIHVIECLRNSNGDAAWDLMEYVYGKEWTCKPEELPTLIEKALIKVFNS